MRASGGQCPRPLMGPPEIIPDGVLRALTWKPARFSTSYNQNRRRSCSRAQLTAGGVTDEDANSAYLFRRLHCCARTDWHADRAGQSADQAMRCFAIKDTRALVLAPDRRAKMLVRRQDRDLEIIAEVACSGARASESQGRRVSAQAKVKVSAPVIVATEKRSGPMDAQARMLDDDSFESRWRARVTAE